MKNRYWMSFALSAAILAGMAAGCGSETVSESEPGSSSESAGEARKAPLVFVAPSDTPYADDADNAEVMDLIHDQFLADRNIDLEIQIKDCSWTGYQDLMQVEMASGVQIDLFPAWSDMASTFISNEMVYSLDESLEKYGENIRKVVPELAWRWMVVDGQTYGLPRLRSENDVQWQIIRKDWLDELGLELPTNLEEYEKVLYAIKAADPVGNGNTIPYQAYSTQNKDSFFGLANTYKLSANQMTDYYLGEDGQVHYAATNPDYKAALDLQKKWLADGILNKDFFSVSADEDKMRKNQHVVAVQDGKKSSWVATIDTLKDLDPDGEYAIIPFDNVYEKSKIASDLLLVPANSENLDVVIQYFDWMLEDKANFMLVNYGIEGKHYTVEGDQISLISPEEGEPNLYRGCYTGTFDLYGLEGYGQDPVVDFVKQNFDDPQLQSIYENEYQDLSAQAEALLDKAVIPDLYGFTYKLEGIAQQTRDQRRTTLSSAAAEYIAGKCDWSKVENAIDQYVNGTGGPEEFQQVNEQYQVWCETFNAK